MGKREPKYPRITALRALELLRMLERTGTNLDKFDLDRLKNAFANHVQADLTKKRRRQARG